MFRATILIGLTGVLVGRVLRRRPVVWYEAEPAEPMRHRPPDDEAVLTRLLLTGGISRDAYRRRIEQLAAREAWSAPLGRPAE